jgi:hypothetical protein
MVDSEGEKQRSQCKMKRTREGCLLSVKPKIKIKKKKEKEKGGRGMRDGEAKQESKKKVDLFRLCSCSLQGLGLYLLEGKERRKEEEIEEVRKGVFIDEGDGMPEALD